VRGGGGALVIVLALALAAAIGTGAAVLVTSMAPAARPGWTAPPISWPSVAGAASPAPAAVATEVVPARAAPPLRLTGTDGRPFDLASLRGTPALVFFGYTHCPDVCPTTLADVRDVIKRSATPVRAVFVSIDPDRDTPAEMGTYLSYYGVPIIGLTGSPTEIRVAADAWGVRYARIDEGSASGYAMAHTADTFLVDGAGMLRHVIPFGSGAEVMLDRIAAVVAAPVPTPAVALASPTPAGPTATPAASAGQSASPLVTPGPPATGATASPGPAGTPAATPSSGVLAELVSTVVRAGRNRLVLTIEDARNRELGRPEVVVTVALRAVDRPADPPITATCQFIWITVGSRAAYVADVTLPRAGQYVATVSASGPAGPLGMAEMPVAVVASAPVVAVGDPAPSVDTPVAADVGGDLRLISSDIYPDGRFYQQSVADLLAEHRPFVLTIYSPAFCPTTACGPLLRNLKLIATEFPAVGFVHAEPYVMQDLGGRIQPALDEGVFEWAPWSVAYGIPREPWVFVVGPDGRVAASYELIVGTDELRAAIRSVSGGG
jgi:protein SCO1/2